MLSHFSHAQLFATPWTAACQALLSMGFPRQGVGCHLHLQGIFLTQGSNQSLLRLSLALCWGLAEAGGGGGGGGGTGFF